MKPLLKIIYLGLGLILVASLDAAVPQLISYQGRVLVDGNPFEGTGQFKFALVSTTGSITFWSNNGGSVGGSEPTAAVSLPVTKGNYSVLLGDATISNMTVASAAVFTNADVRLRIWFNDGVNGFNQLLPDHRIAAVGYAMMAESVSDGAITTAKLANNAVTTAQIADNSITTTKIAAGAVGASQLAAGAVSADKIASGTISSAQLAKPYLSGRTNTADVSLSTFQDLDITIPFSPAFPSSPIVTANFANGGSGENYHSLLVVKNASASAAQLLVDLKYTPVNIQTSAVNSRFNFRSMDDINGYPGIAYSYPGIAYQPDTQIKFVRAATAIGSAWAAAQPAALLVTNRYLRSLSLSTATTNPAIAYSEQGPNFDYTNKATNFVSFVRSIDPTGSVWAAPIAVWSTVLTQQALDVSQLSAGGNPALVLAKDTFVGGGTSAVAFVRSVDTQGNNWGSPIEVVPNGRFAGSLIANGNPMIFYVSLDGTLYVVRATVPTGATWGSPVTVVVGYPGSFPPDSSCAIVAGKPAFLWQDNAKCYYVTALDVNGYTWGAVNEVSSIPSLSYIDSLNLLDVGGKPAICFTAYFGDRLPPSITYCIASNSAGAAWEPPKYLYEGDGFNNNGPLVAGTINGQPGIVFTEGQNFDTLRYLSPNQREKPVINWIAVSP